MPEGGAVTENILTIPEAGGELRISVNPGDNVRCGFTPENSAVEIRGEDLAFTSEAGGSLVLVGFVPALDKGGITLDFGDVSVSGADIYASLTADFSTDFGQTASNGEADASLFAPSENEHLQVADLLDTNPPPPLDHLPFTHATVADVISPHPHGDPFVLSVARIPSPEDDIPPHLRLDLPL